MNFILTTCITCISAMGNWHTHTVTDNLILKKSCTQHVCVLHMIFQEKLIWYTPNYRVIIQLSLKTQTLVHTLGN